MKAVWNKSKPPVSDVELRQIGYSLRISGGHRYVVRTGEWSPIGNFTQIYKTYTKGTGWNFFIEGILIGTLSEQKYRIEPPAVEAEKIAEVFRKAKEYEAERRAKVVRGENPLDLTRSSYMKCVWPGCDGGACTVKSTEHARGVPTMFYVFCPECGAHGPECWEKSEAARRWRERNLGHHPEAKISAAVGSEAPDKR